jgi:transcriptional regulator with XRE-family HTH domain
MEKIGTRIRNFRLRRKLTVTECAQQLKVSPSTFREWEYGRAIQGEPYVELASLLDVSLHELLTGRKTHGASSLEELSEIERRLGKVRKSLLSLF